MRDEMARMLGPVAGYDLWYDSKTSGAALTVAELHFYMRFRLFAASKVREYLDREADRDKWHMISGVLIAASEFRYRIDGVTVADKADWPSAWREVTTAAGSIVTRRDYPDGTPAIAMTVTPGDDRKFGYRVYSQAAEPIGWGSFTVRPGRNLSDELDRTARFMDRVWLRHLFAGDDPHDKAGVARGLTLLRGR